MSDGYLIQPKLPPGVRGLDFFGLKYRGATFDVRIYQSQRITVTLKAVTRPSEMHIILAMPAGVQKLRKIGATVEMRWQMMQILVVQL